MRKFLTVIFCFSVLIFCAFTSLNFQAAFFWQQSPTFALDFSQKEALKNIKFPIKITAYLQGNPKFQKEIKSLIFALQQHISNLNFEIKKPENFPLEVKERKITSGSELWVENALTAQGLKAYPSPSSLIAALLELSGAKKESIAHIIGDNEKRAFETQDSWVGAYELLKNSNFIANEINLSQTINIPQNTKLAVFASSKGDKVKHWDAAIKTFVEEGGNLIFATDLEQRYLPPYLAELSGLELIKGVVVDLQGQALGFADPRVIPAEFPINNPLTKNLNELPLLAGAVAFKTTNEPQQAWQRSSVLRSSLQSWNETSPIYGSISLDGEEQKGPLSIAWLLERELADNKKQKILIIGESDLFTKDNVYRGGNDEFAKALFSYFTELNALTVQNSELKDQYIKLKNSTELAIAFFMIFVLPLLILLFGIKLRKNFKKKYEY